MEISIPLSGIEIRVPNQQPLTAEPDYSPDWQWWGCWLLSDATPVVVFDILGYDRPIFWVGPCLSTALNNLHRDGYTVTRYWFIKITSVPRSHPVHSSLPWCIPLDVVAHRAAHISFMKEYGYGLHIG